ncbi:MAG: T9SS type A sorting domain-containing protein, partial [Candidatus Kapaibacterium sp.]
EDSYVEIELFDIFGKSLFKIEERKPSGSFSIPIDLKELQTGVYFIKSKINNTQFNNKFMKK